GWGPEVDVEVHEQRAEPHGSDDNWTSTPHTLTTDGTLTGTTSLPRAGHYRLKITPLAENTCVAETLIVAIDYPVDCTLPMTEGIQRQRVTVPAKSWRRVTVPNGWWCPVDSTVV